MTSSKPLFDSKWPVYTRYTISQMAINNVANTLTRDNDRTEDELTQILHSHRPSQLPQHFEIVPLPRDRLMVILASSTAACQITVGANTLDSKTWAWNHYSGYC